MLLFRKVKHTNYGCCVRTHGFKIALMPICITALCEQVTAVPTVFVGTPIAVQSTVRDYNDSLPILSIQHAYFRQNLLSPWAYEAIPHAPSFPHFSLPILLLFLPTPRPYPSLPSSHVPSPPIPCLPSSPLPSPYLPLPSVTSLFCGGSGISPPEIWWHVPRFYCSFRHF